MDTEKIGREKPLDNNFDRGAYRRSTETSALEIERWKATCVSGVESYTLESRPASRLFSTNAYVRALKEARVPATLPYSNSFFFFLFFSFFFFFIFFSRTLRRRLSRAAAARCSGSTYNYHPTLETLYRVFEVVGEFRWFRRDKIKWEWEKLKLNRDFYMYSFDWKFLWILLVFIRKDWWRVYKRLLLFQMCYYSVWTPCIWNLNGTSLGTRRCNNNLPLDKILTIN